MFDSVHDARRRPLTERTMGLVLALAFVVLTSAVLALAAPPRRATAVPLAGVDRATLACTTDDGRRIVLVGELVARAQE